MPQLGKQIKEQRYLQNLSQKELAVRCGLTDATIQRIECGARRFPRCEHLCKIADALHIRRFHLLKLAGYVTEEDISPSQNIHGLADLSDKDMDELQLFIDFLLHRKMQKETQNAIQTR